jgi:hypothetical protein
MTGREEMPLTPLDFILLLMVMKPSSAVTCVLYEFVVRPSETT